MRKESSLVQLPVIGTQLAKEQLMASGYGLCIFEGGKSRNLKKKNKQFSVEY